MTQHDAAPRRSVRCVAGLSLLFLVAVLSQGGCATFEKSTPPLVPSQNVTRIGSFALYTGRPIAADSPAVRSLTELEGEVGNRLGVKPGQVEPPVEIYVLKDRDAFNHFLWFYYPELPSRRAFFLAQGSKRVVYTYENDRLQEDLRHEATHALLHEALGDLPLWLDEGIAEFFEVPLNRKGVNAEHLARLPTDIEKGWKPDLKRLETLKNVKDMSPRDYRESWAWIHYLLDPKNVGGQTLLKDYLADIKSNQGDIEPLSARLDRLDGGQDGQMLSHLHNIPPVSPDPKGSTTDSSIARVSSVRLQNASVEPKVVTDQRGFFGRFFGFFGIKP